MLQKRFRRWTTATAALLVMGVGMFTTLAPAPSMASSHREAPLTAADPQIDSTDLYAFVSPDKRGTTTIISNWIPFEEPAGGPNFYSFAPGVNYDINIDNDGDAQPDIIYRWVFADHYRNPNTFLYNTGPVTSLSDPDLNFYQTYDLYRIAVGHSATTLLRDVMVAPSDVGQASMPDYASLSSQAIYSGCSRCQFWAGQADDPFFLDLRVFDLLYGGNLSETGDDTLAGFNVNSFAMQVPSGELAARGDAKANPVIGIWTTAERQSIRVENGNGTQSFSGNFVQVSRLGNPLVNEVVIPVGKKDLFNASQPADDGQFAPYVLDPELPHLINAVYGIPVPDCDGNPNDGNVDRSCDLVPVFLTGVSGLNDPTMNQTTDHSSIQPAEELRLNMSIAPCDSSSSCGGYSRLGVIGGDNSGYPNGRRLADDVIDISLRVVEGELQGQQTGLGDGVDHNDAAFMNHFPYLALPWSGSDPDPHDHGMMRRQ